MQIWISIKKKDNLAKQYNTFEIDQEIWKILLIKMKLTNNQMQALFKNKWEKIASNLGQLKAQKVI